MKKKLAIIMLIFTVISMFALNFKQPSKEVLVGDPNDDKIPIDVRLLRTRA
jgi:hypothetical protein